MTPRLLAAIAFPWICTGAVAQLAPDRAVERYLEERNLRSALIEHLDSRLGSVGGDERAALADRLTRLVAEELEASASPSRRAELERRARALLDVIPEGDSLDLRLSLHRAAYSNAEQIAERWRLRLASPEEEEEARRVFSTLGPELARLGAIAHRRVDNLERMEETLREGADEEAIAQQLADSRRQRSMAMYLSGWCLVYQSEMSGQRAPALDSMPRFGWLLNAEIGKTPALDRVPEQTLRFEHVARAALGMSAAISMAGDPSLAIKWIEAVEASNKDNAELLAFAATRRVITLARAGRWIELYEDIRLSRGVSATNPDASPQTALPPANARLLAVLAFELPHAGQQAPQRALRRIAFADLVAQGQTPQVVDLAQRYGTEALGDTGFVTDYVRGLQAFRTARDAHAAAGDPEEPTSEASVKAAYVHAGRLLDAALRASDAASAGEARSDALMLLASCTFFASGNEQDALLASAALFEEASEAVTGRRVTDALWNRLRALRLAAKHATRDRESVESLASAAGLEFSQRFPSDPRAGALVLERAAKEGDGEQNPDLLDALLAVDPGSASYPAARRQAATMLFRAAQSAPRDAARAEALRFAEIAGPMLDADTQAAVAGDRDAGDRAILTARQLLAVLLTDHVSEPALAQRAADRLSVLVRASILLEPDIIAEFRYRELQISLLANDLTRAEAALSALRGIDTPDAARFLAAADRLAYRRALAVWRENPADTSLAEAVVTSGARVIDYFTTAGTSLRDGALLGVYFSVSDAAAVLAARNPDALALARRLLRRVLVEHPTSVQALRRSAELASLAGEHADAAEAWRVMLAGADFGSDAWFEAAYERARATSRVNGDDAARMLARHYELFETGGPPPWDTRFAALRDSLRAGAPNGSAP